MFPPLLPRTLPAAHNLERPKHRQAKQRPLECSVKSYSAILTRNHQSTAETRPHRIMLLIQGSLVGFPRLSQPSVKKAGARNYRGRLLALVIREAVNNNSGGAVLTDLRSRACQRSLTSPVGLRLGGIHPSINSRQPLSQRVSRVKLTLHV